jgi:hypothetical protein
MIRMRTALLAATLAALVFGADAFAGGQPRRVFGGHPYHNGNFFIPPSSAYEATRVFPPARYGFPAYYVPGSYLPAAANPAFPYAYGNAYPVQHPYTWYPGVPQGRAGGYYLSAYGYYHTANW